MSYEHGTPHYNLPQTQDSDTRDWFDSNEAFAAIDAAIYSAGQTAGAATADIDLVKVDVNNLKEADIQMTQRVDGIESRTETSERAIQRLQEEVEDVDTDLKDSICAIEEASATAAYAHASGTYFWYNGTLYKATQNIAVGQQIVPDTNCRTTNITTELLEQGGGVEIDDSTTSVSKVWSSSKTNNEISTRAPSADVYTKSQVYTKAEIDALLAQIGGSMPILDYANPLHTFSSGNLSYTATDDCWLLGSIAHYDGGSSANSRIISVSIDGVTVGGCALRFSDAYGAGASCGGDISGIPVARGSVIAVSEECPNLHVFTEA